MLAKKEQRSLEEGSIVKYGGVLATVSHFINENQVVIYTVQSCSPMKTVELTDRLLTLPEPAERLAHRLLGSHSNLPAGLPSVCREATAIAQELTWLAFQLSAEAIYGEYSNLGKVSSP